MTGHIVVTGCAGFIGSHLTDRLLADGHTVRVIDNFSTGSRENLAAVGGDVELIEGDIRSYERTHAATTGVDCVIHLAARDAGTQRVVMASSSSVYGIEVAALRYFNVFGPRQDPNSQYSGVIPKFLSQALDGVPLVAFGDVRDSLADVCSATAAFGYAPSVGLSLGLAEYLAWLREDEISTAKRGDVL